MSISQELWLLNQDLAQACLHHPFVQGIATGNLPQEKFAYYVGQDTFFLQAFARAYSIAAAKSPNFQILTTFHNLAGGVLQELQLHQSYAQKWGVDLHNITPDIATRRYTDFLLATAWGGDVGMTAAAMSPCMALYGFLGKELAKAGIPQHDYSDWIETYSSDDFKFLVAELETVVDRYGSKNDILGDTYRYGMLCELDFFSSAHNFQGF